MPRITRQIHEYYDNRIVHGLYCEVADEGKTLTIKPGAAVVNKQLIGVPDTIMLSFDDKFKIDGNKERRTDIITLDTLGQITVINGKPGEVFAPAVPPLTTLIAQISLPPGWLRFVGRGAEDEILSIRSQHVIDTRFEI